MPIQLPKLTLLLLMLLLPMLACSGCTTDEYKPLSPYQTLVLTADVTAKVSFPMTMPDGTKQIVESSETLRAGGWYIFPTAEQVKAYQRAATRPATKP